LGSPNVSYPSCISNSGSLLLTTFICANWVNNRRTDDKHLRANIFVVFYLFFFIFVIFRCDLLAFGWGQASPVFWWMARYNCIFIWVLGQTRTCYVTCTFTRFVFFLFFLLYLLSHFGPSRCQSRSTFKCCTIMPAEPIKIIYVASAAAVS